jgi:tagaturonate reductase
MDLSRQTIGSITNKAVDLPAPEYFSLPEKVLQFGTGVLLRGLPDFFVDKANKAGQFKGRIVLVKSTRQETEDAFARQDGLFTHCLLGMEGGKPVEKMVLNASISRLLHAGKDWERILTCAENPRMQIIISNTTEVGIQLADDRIGDLPPASFPAKLLAFLYRRYQIFGRDPEGGMIVIPTELIPDNGNMLREILLELCRRNGLEPNFSDWLMKKNDFCNSLVDRIVPGKLELEKQEEKEIALGYRDQLMIMSEPYGLWAIESGKERVRAALSFQNTDPGVVIAEDISVFRELKLRLLNGAHSLSCGLAILSGLPTVSRSMENPLFSGFIRHLMTREIAPSLTLVKISEDQALEFTDKVLDRFRNPFIEHRWLAISLQYSSKMRLRNVPSLLRFMERFGEIPECMSLGFAAYILFLRVIPGPDGRYYGDAEGKSYLVQDDQAPYFARIWSDPESVVERVLSNTDLWGNKLSELAGFSASVSAWMDLLGEKGGLLTLEKLMTIKGIGNI